MPVFRLCDLIPEKSTAIGPSSSFRLARRDQETYPKDHNGLP